MPKKSWYLFLLPLVAFSQYSADEWEARDEWMGLDNLFKHATVTLGMNVADIGCHEGYLTVRLARRVGSSGRVYAEDVNKVRLERLREHAQTLNLDNVVTLLGEYDNPKLPLESFDRIFVIDTYHEIYDFKKVLRLLHRSLKRNGQLIILEKLKRQLEGVSRQAQAFGHTMAPNYVKEELYETGFRVVDEDLNHGFWENDPDKRMWFVVAEKVD
ncbi:MAG: class I SAM-dependent methyltransferase [Flavobacteriaceae bacterium]|nr:class I SAM-dependent methyltransferase [Flavobacteriaceae bacterium]